MAKTELAGTDYPATAADALEALEILRRAYVPKNTTDATYCLAALNVLRRDLPFAEPNVTGLTDAAVEKLMEWPSGAMANAELFDMTYRVRQVADAAFKAGAAGARAVPHV